jgi:autotransporter-associated beta strand protein
MKPSRNLFLGSLLLVAAAIGLHTTAHAAVLTWDADTGTTGAQDGGGTWTAGGAGWWDGATNANWTNGDVATFGSGSGSAGSYAITLGGDVSVSTPSTGAGTVLTFASPGNYTISAASAQTISFPVIVATTANQVTNIVVTKNVTATIGDNVKLSRTAASASRGQISVYGGATASTTDGGILVIGSGTEGGNAVLENLSLNHLIEIRQGITLEVKTGGTFTSTSSMVLGSTSGTEANHTNTLKITGGTVNVGSATAANLVIGNNVNAAGTSTSMVTISEGALNINPPVSGAAGLRFGTNTTSGNTNATYVANGTLNLDGGIVTVGRIYEGTVNNGAVINSTVNFNGGELKVLSGTNNAATFMTGLNTAQVRDGGAKIHTNGVDTTIAQPLVHSTIGGDNATDGGLEKRGSGTLTLSASNTYTGDTTVTEGTLSLGNGTANSNLDNTSDVSIAAGATLNLNFTSGPADADTVAKLFLGTPVAQVPAGTYNSSHPTYGSYFTGTGSLIVTNSPGSSAYEQWATVTHGLSGPNAAFDFDYDNDGIENGLEWILGGDPTTNSSAKAPTPSRNPAGDLVLTFTREETSITGSTLKVLIGTDLATWPKEATVGPTTSETDANGVTVTINTDASPDSITVTIPATNAAAGKIFARLIATQP